MLMLKKLILGCVVVFLFTCQKEEKQQSISLQSFDLPVPVDTKSKAVTLQEKRTYTLGALHASNEFKGARLNAFYQHKDSIIAVIQPENSPINDSPWYAFKLWADEVKNYTIYLKYQEGKHRYHPKWSKDFEHWTALNSRQVQQIDSVTVALNIAVGTEDLYIAAQPVQNSDIVNQWMQEKAKHPAVSLKTIGQSIEGQDINCLMIGHQKNKPTVCLIGRQHPPEVTGWFAQKEFVNYLLEDIALNQEFLSHFNLIVYPLLNPDGVDHGHWRHNLGGVDMNRDWAKYEQKENKQIAQSIVDYINEMESQLVLGVDFHSTYYDVFYENHDPSFELSLPNFKSEWIAAIQAAMPEESFKVSEIEIGKPISMDWFSRQFGAPGVTYEIGDKTPYPAIKRKAKFAAQEMMQLLLDKKDLLKNE